MIRPHLAHEPLRFDSVDMLRLEVRWVDVEGQSSLGVEGDSVAGENALISTIV
jgi:hypothetical protein